MEDAISNVVSWLQRPAASRLLGLAFVVVVVVVVVRTFRRYLAARIEGAAARHQARKWSAVFGWLVILGATGAVFSDRLASIALSVGVAGAGVAFALQEVIASAAGRVAILFGNFYKTGDRVQLGGIKGDVIDIGLLRTTIMEVGDWVKGDLFTGRVVRVANSFIFKEPVFNYSGDFAFLWDEITVPIKYGCNHREAKRMLDEAVVEVTGAFSVDAEREWAGMLQKYNVEPARVAPMVTLVANDNWMEFTVRYVVPYTKRRGTKDRLFTNILDRIEASDGQLVLASATFELVQAPPFRVRLDDGG